MRLPYDPTPTLAQAVQRWKDAPKDEGGPEGALLMVLWDLRHDGRGGDADALRAWAPTGEGRVEELMAALEALHAPSTRT